MVTESYVEVRNVYRALVGKWLWKYPLARRRWKPGDIRMWIV